MGLFGCGSISHVGHLFVLAIWWHSIPPTKPKPCRVHSDPLRQEGVLAYEILNEPWIGDWIANPLLFLKSGEAERV